MDDVAFTPSADSDEICASNACKTVKKAHQGTTAFAPGVQPQQQDKREARVQTYRATGSALTHGENTHLLACGVKVDQANDHAHGAGL